VVALPVAKQAGAVVVALLGAFPPLKGAFYPVYFTVQKLVFGEQQVAVCDLLIKL